MKTCTKCKESKAPDEFVKNNRRKDGQGRGPWCQSCQQSYLDALGMMRDTEVAKRFGKHVETVRQVRVGLSIPSFRTQRVSRKVVDGHLTKVCTKCQTRKAMEEFGASKHSVDERAPECSVCHQARGREYSLVYYAKNAEKFAQRRMEDLDANRSKGRLATARRRRKRNAELAQLKSAPCIDCGLTFDPCVMDFDHRDQNQKVSSVCALVTRAAPWFIVLAEIAKCDLRCACCHRLKSQQERNTRQHVISKKRQMLRGLKEDPCTDCGDSFHYCQMDFDHVRGVKRGEVSRLTCLPVKAILDEVSKCDLVCANCHRVRTHSRRETLGRTSESLASQVNERAAVA